MTRQFRESGRAESLREMVFRMYGRGENVFTKIKPTFSRKIAVKEYRKNGVVFEEGVKLKEVEWRFPH